MDNKNYRPYMDICRVTGKYEKDGKTRNRYHKVGVIMASPHLSNTFQILDSNPVPGERLAHFIRDDWQGVRPPFNKDNSDEPQQKYQNAAGAANNNINPSDIPF